MLANCILPPRESNIIYGETEILAGMNVTTRQEGRNIDAGINFFRNDYEFIETDTIRATDWKYRGIFYEQAFIGR